VTTRISRNDLCPCGSGRKYKLCCLRKTFRVDIPRIQQPGADGASLSNYTRQIRFNRIKPKQEPETVIRVELTYVSENGFGTAEVSFAYLLGTPIIMRNGGVLQAEHIEPGMEFRLEDGGYATVTHAKPPKEYECPSKTSGIVVGRVKYSGHHPRMDMHVSGELIQSTPGHVFWSPTRRAWEPLENFRAGDYLSNREGNPIRIDWISSVYWEYGDLFNLEVEDAHTYFIGGGDHGGILTHNGLDMGCRVPRALVAGPSGALSTNKFLAARWDQGTFTTVWKSIDYHLARHGQGLSAVEYTQRAMKALGDSSATIRRVTDRFSGRSVLRVFSTEFGEGLFTLQGRIIWFHPRVP